MKTKTVKMTPKEIQDLKKRYSNCQFRTDIPYTHFQIKGSDFTITAYTSGKVVFQAKEMSNHTTTADSKPVTMSGSDEVGTGDDFGPITVCACIVRESDYDKLPLNEIMDSKQITDEKILSLAPILMKNLDYSLLILENEKYNEIQKTNNMNAIKAKMHNQAFLNLEKNFDLPKLNVIDQFSPEKTYYNYLKDEPQVFKKLRFETKAENKFLAVACGAIIARYAFLKTLEKMCQTYDFDFPKGASSRVDEAGLEFVKIHGSDTLNMVAKVHFKNTEKILNQL